MEIMSEKMGSQQEVELRRGPWTPEEDSLLIHYVACHGEGRWNLLAKSSGLKRTGKSCRLRWLNYLKPDVKRGNLSPEEQLLILDLHSKWGNRWSRIAQHLPGRTDNEIKNFWRTRVQKQARQLKIDVNSPVFRDALRWMPRLLEKMGTSHSFQSLLPNTDTTALNEAQGAAPLDFLSPSLLHSSRYYHLLDFDNCSTSISSGTLPFSQVPELTDQFLSDHSIDNANNVGVSDSFASGSDYSAFDCGMVGNNCMIETYMIGLDGVNSYESCLSDLI